MTDRTIIIDAKPDASDYEVYDITDLADPVLVSKGQYTILNRDINDLLVAAVPIDSSGDLTSNDRDSFLLIRPNGRVTFTHPEFDDTSGSHIAVARVGDDRSRIHFIISENVVEGGGGGGGSASGVIVGGALDGSGTAVDPFDVKDGGIDSARLADNAVDTEQLATAAVHASIIADGAVETDKIDNAAVTDSKIADDAIDTHHIADDAITHEQMANGSIGTSQLVDSAVTTAKIHDDAITTQKIGSKVITGSEIADNTLLGDHLVDGAVGADQIADGAVSSNHLTFTTTTASVTLTTGQNNTLRDTGLDIPSTGEFFWLIVETPNGRENPPITLCQTRMNALTSASAGTAPSSSNSMGAVLSKSQTTTENISFGREVSSGDDNLTFAGPDIGTYNFWMIK